ncbi:hypothetical protein [Streptomyces sp. NPDC058613]|uniref:hypothetical protein n=1 Tax=unclassified Streptomyces TaxID=2593676 RepID=UPI003650271A
MQFTVGALIVHEPWELVADTIVAEEPDRVSADMVGVVPRPLTTLLAGTAILRFLGSLSFLAHSSAQLTGQGT